MGFIRTRVESLSGMDSEENRRETLEAVSLDKPWVHCEVNDEVTARRKSGEQGSLVLLFYRGALVAVSGDGHD